MKKAILHISDLHVVNHLDANGEPITSELSSFFNTNNSDGFRNAFLQTTIDFIKSKFSETEFHLVVTGDISDSAKEKEFREASRILNELASELNIEKKNILLIPGDHDVNWNDCTIAYEKENNEKKAYDYHKEKFEKFTEFFNDFYSDEEVKFNAENALVGNIKPTSNSIIIGINTNFRIGAQSGEGYVDLYKLKQELEDFLTSHPSKHIFAAFHHNMEARYENRQNGNWEEHNLHQVKNLLLSKNIKVLFYGNEHTSFSMEEDGAIFHSAVGTLSKRNPIYSLKIYEIDESDGFSLNISLFNYHCQNSPKLPSKGFWSITDSPQEEKKFVIKKPVSEIETTTRELQIVENTINEQPIVHNIEPTDYSQKLFNLVKERKLFHSGHFHWSETSRAHNWIDVTKILNKHNDLIFAKNAILDLTKKNINDDFDFVIGLGIEGNILSTKTSIEFAKPYSFLPYSYRYDDHNGFEKELCFDNLGKYKSVLIITDVVNDGRTIRKLIHKRAIDFFKDVEKIFVVSLFYTGNIPNPNTNILNITKAQLTSKGIEEDDHSENRISYYFVTAMKVEECPYKKDYKTACLLMQNPDLGCIHKFYDDEKIKN